MILISGDGATQFHVKVTFYGFIGIFLAVARCYGYVDYFPFFIMTVVCKFLSNDYGHFDFIFSD